MKLTLTALLIIAMTADLVAECSVSGLHTFPSGGSSIKQNSMIVLEGYATTRKVIRSLNKEYPVYLESDGHKVTLEVRETLEGMFRLTQAILIPTEPLVENRTYTLRIDSLDEDQRFVVSRWDSESHARVPITWTVVGGIDTTEPSILGDPVLSASWIEFMGCGPEVYASFSVPAEDESELLFKTELVDLKTEESHTYYLSLDHHDLVRAGHGMCSGAFSYEPHKTYKIRFSVLDICGNETEIWSDWVEFDSPYVKRQNRKK